MLDNEWGSRVKKWLHMMQKQFYMQIGDISWEGFFTMERLSYEEAVLQDCINMEEGLAWGENYEYMWLKGLVRVPESCKGKRMVLNLQPGGEACIYINGMEFGTKRAESVTEEHHYILDQTLTESAEGGACYEIVLEVYAGHPIPIQEGFCEAYPLTKKDPYFTHTESEPRAVLGSCSYGIWREDIYQLWLDAFTLYDLSFALSENSYRRLKIEEGLKQFSRIVVFGDGMEESIQKAKTLLRPLLECRNGSTVPAIYAQGHAHIDLAWLWPVAETKRKALRTLAAQIRLMDEYPDYIFMQSQPALYEMVKFYYPQLYKKIKEKVSAGQWIPEGASYVEMDTNLTGGEALIRQILIGKQFFREEFNVDCKLMWLPDVFGYSAALPQILKKSGVLYFTTQKLFWTYNGGERFPYNYFIWQGIDGSEVTAHVHYQYDAQTNPSAVIGMWEGRSQKENMDGFLLPFGYGDGGGGATRDHMEFIRRQNNLEGAPILRCASPIDYFEEQGRPAEKYVGELYYNCHRGTLTSQADIKNRNRRAEFSLREAEIWSSIAGFAAEKVYPAKKINRLWKSVLFNQFHDILPGSSIRRVYEDALEVYVNTEKEIQKIIKNAVLALCIPEDGITLFNSLSFERDIYVEIPENWEGAADSEGNEVIVGAGLGGRKACVHLPSCGLESVRCAKQGMNTIAVCSEAREIGDGIVLENEKVKIIFNKLGELLSLYDKEVCREIMRGKGNMMELYDDTPHMCDAWDIDSLYESIPIGLERDSQCRILNHKGLEAGFEVKRRFGASEYTQIISLKATEKQVDFKLLIDWKEHHKLLKTSFSVIYEPMEALHEIQFGYLGRPTHKSKQSDKDKFEVCNHRWTALQDNSGGAAILNRSGYGISTSGNTMKLSLLRSPMSPDPCCDQGKHEIRYSFYVWNNEFSHSGVVNHGYALNAPEISVRGLAERNSFFRCDAGNIFLEAWKKAEDGDGYILRLYEAYSMHTSCRIMLPFHKLEAWETDMQEKRINGLIILEDKKESSIELFFKPFEIKTINIRAGG